MSDGATSLDAEQLAELLRTDPCEAVACVRDAAKCGDVGAQSLYAQMLAEGRGVARDPCEALHWFALAANCGHAAAMNMVGRCYELGSGARVDHSLAATW